MVKAGHGMVTHVFVCRASMLSLMYLSWFYRRGETHCYIVRPKSKQDGGIRSEKRFKTSVGSGIDADRTEKRKL